MRDHRTPKTYFQPKNKEKRRRIAESTSIVQCIFEGNYQEAKAQMKKSLTNRLTQKKPLQRGMERGGKQMQDQIFG